MNNKQKYTLYFIYQILGESSNYNLSEDFPKILNNEHFTKLSDINNFKQYQELIKNQPLEEVLRLEEIISLLLSEYEETLLKTLISLDLIKIDL